jgi:hypothetical protein
MVESTITKKPWIPYDTLHWQNSRRIARISNGTYFFFYCNNTFPHDNIDSARSFDGGVTWHHWMVIDEHPPDMYCPSTIPDSHNNIHLVWMYGGNIKYRMYNTTNNSWTGSQYISSVGTVWGGGNEPTLDIDSNNKLWCAWYNSNPYYTAQCVNSTDLGSHWSTVKNISTESPCAASGYIQSTGMFAFKSNGDGFYVWTGNHVGMIGDLSKYCIRMRKWYAANSSWSTEIINVSTPLGYVQTQRFAGIATGSNDNLHITWYNFDAPKVYYRVYYAANNSFSGCNYVAVGVYPSIALDSTGATYILYGYPLEHGPGSGYANISYVRGSIASWTTVKVTRWNGTGENVFKDPVSFYSRYPIGTSGYPVNAPAGGLAFCFMNLSYWKNYELGVQTIGRIYFRLENVTWTLGCPGYTITSQNVNTTRATLKAKIGTNTSYVTSSAGFFIRYNAVPTGAAYDFNVTAGSGYGSGKPWVWYNMTGLTPSKYYYVRAWFNDGTFRLANTTYMLMKPLNASGVSVVSIAATSAHLKWTNPSIVNGSLRAVCRWSTASYPGTITSGASGFNVSTTAAAYGHANASGLSPGSKVYFSVFLYLQAAGSPLLQSFSSSYTGIVGNTSGGTYNLTFLYENNSQHHPFFKVHGTTHTMNHTLIVYYSNKTEYNYFNYTVGLYGETRNESMGDWGKTYRGYIILNLSQTPMSFEFRWNMSKSTSGIQELIGNYCCIRKRIPIDNVKNVTFYVTTNREVYGVSTAVWNTSLVPYIISISDFSSLFLTEPGLTTYVYFYKYDNNGTRQIISEEYVDSFNRVYPWLIHGDTYYWGIGKADYVLDQMGIVPTFDYTQTQTIIVRYNPVGYDAQFNLTTGRINPHHAGIWLNYAVAGGVTNSVDIKVYDMINMTQVYGASSGLSTFNFTYAGTLANRSYYYVFRHNGTSSYYSFSVSWYIFNTNQTLRWNGSRMNLVLNLTLGKTPFYNPDTGKEVSWLNGGIIFGVFLLLIFSGTKMEVPILLGAGGLWFIFAGAMFFTAALPACIPLGAFFVVMAIIYKPKRDD